MSRVKVSACSCAPVGGWHWALAAIVPPLLFLSGQESSAQTSSAVNQALADQTATLRRYAPPQPVGTLEINVEDLRERTPMAEAERIRFTLRSLTVEGAETVPIADLRPIWTSQLGTVVSLADLYAIADAIDAAYLRAGYFSMTVVPVQTLATGEITIVVYESYIKEVRISSPVPGIERRLAPYIDRITGMRPIRVREAERALLLMSDLAGLDVVGTLVRPPHPSGGGALELEIGFERRAGLVSLDNYGSSSAGPLQLTGVVAFNDLLGLFDSVTFVGATVPDDPSELLVLQASQDLPIGSNGLMLGYSITRVAATPDAGPGVAIDAETLSGMVHLRYPFVRTIAHSLFGRIELNARNDDVDVNASAATRERARWLLAALRYDRALGEGDGAAIVSFGQGIGGLGANSAGGEMVSRAGVPEDYRLGRLDLEWRRPLGDTASLWIRAAGQYTDDPLPAAVQFTVGGDPYGWAFNGDGLSGDRGLAGAVEVDHPVDPGISALSDATLRLFADYGGVWNSPGADFDTDALGSIGIGASGVIHGRVMAQVSVATAWKRPSTIDDPGLRAFFSVGMTF